MCFDETLERTHSEYAGFGGGTSCNNNGMVPTYEIVRVVRYVDNRKKSMKSETLPGRNRTRSMMFLGSEKPT